MGGEEILALPFMLIAHGISGAINLIGGGAQASQALSQTGNTLSHAGGHLGANLQASVSHIPLRGVGEVAQQTASTTVRATRDIPTTGWGEVAQQTASTTVRAARNIPTTGWGEVAQQTASTTVRATRNIPTTGWGEVAQQTASTTVRATRNIPTTGWGEVAQQTASTTVRATRNIPTTGWGEVAQQTASTTVRAANTTAEAVGNRLDALNDGHHNGDHNHSSGHHNGGNTVIIVQDPFIHFPPSRHYNSSTEQTRQQGTYDFDAVADAIKCADSTLKRNPKVGKGIDATLEKVMSKRGAIKDDGVTRDDIEATLKSLGKKHTANHLTDYIVQSLGGTAKQAPSKGR